MSCNIQHRLTGAMHEPASCLDPDRRRRPCRFARYDVRMVPLTRRAASAAASASALSAIAKSSARTSAADLAQLASYLLIQARARYRSGYVHIAEP
jgi:hypothetical protein